MFCVVTYIIPEGMSSWLILFIYTIIRTQPFGIFDQVVNVRFVAYLDLSPEEIVEKLDMRFAFRGLGTIDHRGSYLEPFAKCDKLCMILFIHSDHHLS